MIISIFFSLNANIVIGVDCKRLSKNELYMYSDLIAIGKIENHDDNIYYVRILERFKGKSDSIIIVDKKNAPNLHKSKYWLIYAFETNGRFIIPFCSGTKSFNMPIDIHNIMQTEPPPSYILKDKALNFMYQNEYINNAKKELITEIMGLRQLKMENQLLSLKKESISTKESYKVLQEQYSNIRNQNNIIIGILILVNAIIFVFILTQLFRIFKGNASHTS